jgi:hypothetical protein
VEEDSVADDSTLGGDRHVLLGHVHREVGHAVDPVVGQQPQRIRARDEQVDHVMALVVQHRRLTPGDRFAAPVGELGRYDRIDVGSELRVPEQLDGVPRLVQQLLQVLRAHLPPILVDAVVIR